LARKYLEFQFVADEEVFLSIFIEGVIALSVVAWALLTLGRPVINKGFWRCWPRAGNCLSLATGHCLGYLLKNCWGEKANVSRSVGKAVFA
jgi:hypothetical protein